MLCYFTSHNVHFDSHIVQRVDNQEIKIVKYIRSFQNIFLFLHRILFPLVRVQHNNKYVSYCDS